MYLPKEWKKILKILDIAFQPIININTGKLYGVEALLRNFNEAGFVSIFDVFDNAFNDGILYSFDLSLREKVFEKFSKIENYQNIKLFYNLDNRILSMKNFSMGNTNRLLKKFNLLKNNVCFEISERHKVSKKFDIDKLIEHYEGEGFFVAIDDFGVGYSGYKLFYSYTPNIIKIDRFFINEIEKDLKKKLIVKNITQLAILLGIKVIAEGVETKKEYLVCKEIGCHLAQGFLIKKPTLSVKKIEHFYPNIEDVISKDKRKEDKNSFLAKNIEKIEPIDSKTDMKNVIEHFKNRKDIEFVPVVDQKKEPIGILLESKIKEFLYSPYGRDLLLNNKNRFKLKHFVKSSPVADINTPTETLIELFTSNPDSEGIIITKDSYYYGFISTKDIINMIYQENLVFAREQNPLTKLPGNSMIEKYINSISSSKSYLLGYFDLDNFKAFNDVYGFRKGDRVIQLFADILKTEFPKSVFKAHIGGDDFFIAYEDIDLNNFEIYYNEILKILEKFSFSAKDFYSLEDKENGYIISKNREGEVKRFPLLSTSASLLVIKEKDNISEDVINFILTNQKKVAKNSKNHICVSCFLC